MAKQLFTASLAALVVAGAVGAGQAQQGPGGPMMRQGQQQMMQQQAPMGEQERRIRQPRSEHEDEREYERYGQGDMMGRGTMRPGMTGSGMMSPGMMRIMMILMDTDGDGALSLQEVQAVHARFFEAIDADDDGRVTLEEMEGFMLGARPGPGQRN